MQHFIPFYTKKIFNFSININRTKTSKRVLLLVEHNNEDLSPTTKNVVTAAKKIGGDVTALVAGNSCYDVAKSTSNIKGLFRVIVAENKAFNGFPAENLTPLILNLQRQFSFTHIIGGSTSFCKSILPRVAAKLDVAAITDVTEVKSPDIFVKPTYSGNVLMTVKVNDSIKVVTVRQSSFPPSLIQDTSKLQKKLALITKAMNLQKPISNKGGRVKAEQYLRLKRAAETLTKWQKQKGAAAFIKEVIPSNEYNLGLTTIIRRDFPKSRRPKLMEAETIICAGKGIGSEENLKVLYDFADALNAAVGASESAIDAGFATKDMYIGRNGKIISPKLFIAVGLSGKIRDIAAIKESETIIAINKDPKSPIFEIADYGLVGDLFEIIPKFTTTLKTLNRK